MFRKYVLLGLSSVSVAGCVSLFGPDMDSNALVPGISNIVFTPEIPNSPEALRQLPSIFESMPVNVDAGTGLSLEALLQRVSEDTGLEISLIPSAEVKNDEPMFSGLWQGPLREVLNTIEQSTGYIWK